MGRQIYYTREVRHEGLNKYRLIRHTDEQAAQEMADKQQRQWKEIWQKKVEREKRALSKNEKKEIALTRTNEAHEAISQLEYILITGLNRTFTLNWENLKDRRPFPNKKPIPSIPTTIPSEPAKTDYKYIPRIGLLDQLFSSRRAKKEKTAKELFENDHEVWIKEKNRIEIANKQFKTDHETKLASWQQELENWQSEQQKQHADIDSKKQQYLELQSEAINDYCETVLSNSVYPDWFPQDFDLDYTPATKTIIVDYSFPDKNSMPRVSEVKYIITSDSFKETLLPDSTINKLYDPLLYRISLRTMHEIYATDVAEAIDSIVFNGWVTTTDLGTGHMITSCILSVQSQKEEFKKLNLRDVDPKACFKKLKGISSSKLHGMAAVAPIMTINREDSRFIQAHNVAHLIDDSVNIAAMDWQEFEHLIREIFEKEFSSGGGEVKITQASRDRGVDAIAIDPDPIRGGRIVIQAKRYTNTVDLSAVRDLWGTVMNEGAMKGILVTTSDYGPDAYAFTKDKPLTLLSGGNLLAMLAKHGHKAKIDLAEAKMMMSTE